MRELNAKDFKVKCEVFVRALNNEKVKNHHFLMECSEFKGWGYGWPELISIEEIFNNADKYLKNNTVDIGNESKLTS